MKLVIVGAGALRNISAVRDYCLIGNEVHNGELVLVDTDPERAETVTELTRKMPEILDAGIQVEGATSLEEALPGADFVYTTIRVGGVGGMLTDENIGAKYGFAGHDDFGPSGAFITLRTLPVMVDIARKMERHCPEAWLLNLTNPVALIAEGLTQTTPIKHFGLCGGDANLCYDLADIMGWESPAPFEYLAAGIDHFGWWVECSLEGKPFYPMLDERLKDIDISQLKYYLKMTAEVYKIYGMALFASAHCMHWFYHDHFLDGLLRRQQSTGPDRAEKQKEAFQGVIDLTRQVTTEGFWENETLAKLAASHNLATSVMEGFIKGDGKLRTVNVRNEGAITNLPDDATVEVSCKFENGGFERVRGMTIPDEIAPLTAAIVAHQKLVVKATIEKDRHVLIQAMLADPMMRSLGKVEPMVDELLAANKDCMPGWDISNRGAAHLAARPAPPCDQRPAISLL